MMLTRPPSSFALRTARRGQPTPGHPEYTFLGFSVLKSCLLWPGGGHRHPWRGPDTLAGARKVHTGHQLYDQEIGKVGHLASPQEVGESRDETLGLPYGDGAAAGAGQLSRTLSTGW